MRKVLTTFAFAFFLLAAMDTVTDSGLGAVVLRGVFVAFVAFALLALDERYASKGGKP